jgi:WhiB family transcriptional regulator, redox-sensing transcriptional regulator
MQEQKLMWRQQAACRDYDTDVFFPDSDADAGPALAICATCPVRDACLEFALTTNHPSCTGGAATETQRRRLRRRRRQAA